MTKAQRLAVLYTATHPFHGPVPTKIGKRLKFVAPPVGLPTISRRMLKAGDALELCGTEFISGVIQDAERYWSSHVAMVVEGPDGRLYICEMTWPKSIITPLDEWLDHYGDVWAVRLTEPLDGLQKADLWDWWQAHLGLAYEWPLLFPLAANIGWDRVAAWLHLPKWLWSPNPLAGNGVCSVNVAWAWKAIGRPVTRTSGMTPMDIEKQPFVLPLEKLEAA